MNHLEQLVAEWYEYRGYFVRRNVRVGKRAKGGYDGELDVVAFHPENKDFVHIETSMDAWTWNKRQEKFTQKFARGREIIPTLFPAMKVPSSIDQIALFGYGGRGKANHAQIGGGRIRLIAELLDEILTDLAAKSMHKEAVPEQFPLLRTLHFVAQHRQTLRGHFELPVRSNKSVQPTARTPSAARGG
jgi:hypothetical protein